MCSYMWLWILIPWLCDIWEMHVVIYAWWMIEVELMGGIMLMVSMMLIMYNDGWFGNWYYWKLGWEGCMTWDCVCPLAIDWEVLKWLEVVLGILVKCQCVSWGWLVVDFGTFWMISKRRIEIGMFDWFWKELKVACFENGTLWFWMKTWFLGILWRDITWTTDLWFVPNLFRNEIGFGMSMPFKERVKNDLKWGSYVRRKIGVWICKFCSF